jgi:mono/diheme cytochrome c family protein
MLAPEFGGDNNKRIDPDPFDKPVVAFPAHWAPLQMVFYTATQFPAKYRNGAFVTFHGSWNRAPRAQGGYQVAFVPFDEKGMPLGTYETFADGFAGKAVFINPGDARFRPSGVTVGPDGSLYISETEKGRIWRVFYTGEETSSATPSPSPGASAIPNRTPAPAAAAASDGSRGAEIYQQVCVACHMPDGRGVPGMQAPLVGSAVVSGDPATMIKVLIKGPADVLPANRQKYAVVMPPFATYSDADIAAVATYVRATFGKGASAVSAEHVKAQR